MRDVTWKPVNTAGCDWEALQYGECATNAKPNMKRIAQGVGRARVTNWIVTLRWSFFFILLDLGSVFYSAVSRVKSRSWEICSKTFWCSKITNKNYMVHPLVNFIEMEQFKRYNCDMCGYERKLVTSLCQCFGCFANDQHKRVWSKKTLWFRCQIGIENSDSNQTKYQFFPIWSNLQEMQKPKKRYKSCVA